MTQWYMTAARWSYPRQLCDLRFREQNYLSHGARNRAQDDLVGAGPVEYPLAVLAVTKVIDRKRV